MSVPSRPHQVAHTPAGSRQALTAVLPVLSGWRSALLGTVVLITLLYSGILVWFHTARPNIARNFAAEFNARLETIPKNERAAPLYMQAFPLMPDLPEALHVPGGLFAITPESETWARMTEYLREAQAGLALVRRAAAMPHLGLAISDQPTPGWGLSIAEREFQSPGPSDNPPLTNIMLAHLGTLRNLAALLAADAVVAATAGDGSRAAEDLLATLGAARHVREAPSLIAELISVIIVNRAAHRLGSLLEWYPGVFSENDLARLAAAFADVPVGAEAVRFQVERLSFEDLLQRAYTDNGRDDGRLCAEGLRMSKQLSAMIAGAGSGDLTPAEWFFGPILAYTAATRREVLAEFDRHIQAAQREQRRPRWEGSPDPLLDFGVQQIRTDPAKRRRLELVVDAMPALGNAVERGQQMEQVRDGVLVAIALERYRLAHGAFPPTLDPLAPTYLSSVPPDAIDGRPLRYRLTAGRPTVYSVGADQDDDAGRPPAGQGGNLRAWSFRGPPSDAPDGDFVLWPEPTERPAGASPPL